MKLHCIMLLSTVKMNVNAVRYKDGGRIALMECVWDSQKWHDEIKGDGRSHNERKCKQKECVEMLIKAGANLNAQTDHDISALIKAV